MITRGGSMVRLAIMCTPLRARFLPEMKNPANSFDTAF
jgi:hypothetical protein